MLCNKLEFHEGLSYASLLFAFYEIALPPNGEDPGYHLSVLQQTRCALCGCVCCMLGGLVAFIANNLGAQGMYLREYMYLRQLARESPEARHLNQAIRRKETGKTSKTGFPRQI
ncbi:hypothetical protein LIER_26264 [Lithospermum erythrorhizon]|uniref:Uncharacterized protein n=1 Tax=Lithospermum erythrorhizon TaxID=34254 RepID=A0AAV3RDK5_LITER